MSAQNQTHPQSMRERILDIIREIVDKSQGGFYIYRGEAKHHCKVSSGLYRAYVEAHKKQAPGCEIETPDVVGSQCAILQKLKTYLPEVAENDNKELLIQLQHYGCKTNLIDFTTDYAVALFFACYKRFDEDGRVILLENSEKPEENEGYRTIETLRTINRVEVQKSILVQSKTGFLNIEPPHQIVCVPKDLKKNMLVYLAKHHNISTESIYTDIHGFIALADILPHFLECHKGHKAEEEMQKAADKEEDAAKKEKDAAKKKKDAAKKKKDAAAAKVAERYKKAIEHYDKALALEPKLTEAYIQRAQVHARFGAIERKKGEDGKKAYSDAIRDYEEAKKLDDGNTKVYHELGRIYHYLERYPQAIENYTEAIERDPDNADLYHDRATTNEAIGDRYAAVGDWDKVIELRPDNPEYLYNGLPT